MTIPQKIMRVLLMMATAMILASCSGFIHDPTHSSTGTIAATQSSSLAVSGSDPASGASSSTVASSNESSSAQGSQAISASSSSQTVLAPSTISTRLWWDLTVPNYEVQVPEVVSGECGGPSTCGGWWYGFAQNYGDWSPKNAMDNALITEDTTTGNPFTDGSITRTGLRVLLKAPAALATDKPAIAGIAFNYSFTRAPINISEYSGFSITYTSDFPLRVELGWDESIYGYDTYYAALPVHATSSTLFVPWSVFKKDGWATGSASHPLSVAYTQAVSFKILLKNYGTSMEYANFELQKLE